MQTQTTGATAGVTNQKRLDVTVDLYGILKAHGLDELHLKEDAVLRQYQQLLATQVGRCEATLRTNILKEFAAVIRDDLRLYYKIKDKIDSILTVRFMGK